MTQEWLDTYVASFIPIAGPWSGAGKALRAAVCLHHLISVLQHLFCEVLTLFRSLVTISDLLSLRLISSLSMP